MKLPTMKFLPMNLPHDEFIARRNYLDEITSRWIYLTMKLSTMKLPTMNFPHDEITVWWNSHNEISADEFTTFHEKIVNISATKHLILMGITIRWIQIIFKEKSIHIGAVSWIPTWGNRVKVQFFAQKITKIKLSPLSSKISNIHFKYNV